MDLCMWALQKEELAPKVMSFGGRYGYDDDGETPNTMVSILEYPEAPVIFEVRGLPQSKQFEDAMDHYRGVRIGVVIQCENGYFAGGRGGGWVYDNDGNKIKQYPGDGGGGHQQNFIDAVRSRKVGDLRTDVRLGHVSAALCHMGNISYQLGQRVNCEAVDQAIEGHAQAQDSWKRFKEHLFMNWVDLSKEGVVLGPQLEMDPVNEKFVGETGEYSTTRWANELMRQKYRKPFIVPENV